MRTELSYQAAARQFREFAQPTGDGFPWGDMLREVLDLNTVVVTKRIVAIQGDGSSGTVTLRNILKVTDNDLLELHDLQGETTQIQSIDQLSVAIQRYEQRTVGGQGMLYYLEGTAILATLPFGGAARSASKPVIEALARRAARRTVRYLFRLGLRRLARTIASRSAASIAGFIVKLSRDFIVKYVRAVRLSDMQNEMRIAAGRLPTPLERDRIIREALGGAVADNLLGAIWGGIDDALPGVDASAAITDQMKQAIGRYVCGRMLRVITAPLEEIARSALSYVHDPQSGKTYSEGLTDHMSQAIQGRFSEQLIGAEFSAAIGAMGDNPELVLGH